MTRTTRPGVAAALGNALLTVAAVAGVACIALVVMSALFQVSLIMFKTGSMSPTIPAGSVALVREVPAAEVVVGDIVTVDRPGELPVTHRVTSIAPGGAAGEHVLTMKGDANELEDISPYTVDTVRVTLAHVPGVANVVSWFSAPAVLGGVAVAASAVVTWAFWPREEPREVKQHRHAGRRAGAGTLAVAAVTAAALTGPAEPAFAFGDEEVISGRHLSLLSIAEDVEAMSGMAPGDVVPWQVGIWAEAAEPGIVRAALSGTGGSPAGLLVGVRECAERWAASDCASGERTLRPLSDFPLDGSEHQLTSMPSSEDRWLLIEVAFPADDFAAPDLPAILRLTAAGLGDAIEIGRDPLDPLPETGGTLVVPVVTALGAVGLGLALAGLARTRRRGRS